MSQEIRPITRALLSVSDKTGIVELARALAAKGVEILSTGGTAKLLAESGVKVKEVSEHTGFPEMLDGRVKTLHPKIHGGILGIRSSKEHQSAMQAHDIAPIDLVVVNLYPFEQTVAKWKGDVSTKAQEDIIENIDIGGPAMIRAAAKNHHDVAVVVDAEDYTAVLEELNTHGGTTLTLRRRLAGIAYARTGAYDVAIGQWFASVQKESAPRRFGVAGHLKQTLRYGENPHQQAAFYVNDATAKGLATAKQLQGKELSYNNINDTDAAWALVSEFADTAVVIVKHANPCGVAAGKTPLDAYRKAHACDPESAFGGIVALNRTLDAETAKAIAEIFVEVVIAPDATPEAEAVFAAKKNLRLLVTGGMPQKAAARAVVKIVSGGFLLQDEDVPLWHEAELKTVTKKSVEAALMQDLRFAFTVAKHVKSNAIVFAKDGATIGIGAGQMSRVNSVRIAGWKAKEAKLSTDGAVMASDAFFPFPDNIQWAKELGIAAIVQPGGSIRDAEVIAAADEAGIAMLFTGMRHFRH